MAVPQAESPHPEVTCSVCLELVSDTRERSLAKLKCGHTFHLDCIGSAFNAKGAMQCPNCRGIEHGDWLYGKGCPHPELLIIDQPADDLESSTDWELHSDLDYFSWNEDDEDYSSISPFFDLRSNQESDTHQRPEFSLGVEDLFCGEDVWITRDVPIRRDRAAFFFLRSNQESDTHQRREFSLGDVPIRREDVLIKREDVLIRTEDVDWLGYPSSYAHAQAPVLDWCSRNERLQEWAANLSFIQLTSAYQPHLMLFLGKLPNIRPSGITFEMRFGKLVKEMRTSKKFGHDPFKLEWRNLTSSTISIRRYPFGQHPFNSQGQSGHPRHLHSGKTGHPYHLHLACLVHMCRKLQAPEHKGTHKLTLKEFEKLHKGSKGTYTANVFYEATIRRLSKPQPLLPMKSKIPKPSQL